jgi:preprotein translocase subunit SecA
MLEENLGSEDTKEWNWQALANQANARWNLKLNDRQLKQIGKDQLAEHLNELARKTIEEIDLSGGRPFLAPDWGAQSLSDWARLKFQIKVPAEELAGKTVEDAAALLHGHVLALYRQKEMEFPVVAAMVRYMADRPQAPGAGQRYNREGLHVWALNRFPDHAARLTEEEFRTQSRHRLLELLLEISREAIPKTNEEAIDAQLADALHGAHVSEPEDAKELAEWARSALNVDVSEAELTGLTLEKARQVLWNAFDRKYRPEMRRMERSLLLGVVDSSWKNHLYSMDHLRAGIGLVGYAQEDPKTAYKREGMKEFRGMWDGVEDKVTETVFRMEETDAFQEAVWVIGSAVHEAAPRTPVPDAPAVSTNGAQGDKKVEPIRNRGEKVGRNDPCPCGSGKKYKACHMRQAAV